MIFWFWYAFGFVYLFPLFFIPLDRWLYHPVFATISLFIGIVGWLGFTYLIYKNRILWPKKLKRQIHELKQNGVRTPGEIKSKSLISRHKNGVEEILLTVEFSNHRQTMIESELAFQDSQPELQRFNAGSTIALRLNQEVNSFPLIIETAQAHTSLRAGYLWMLFNVVYSIILFVVLYYLFSGFTGWRFLSIFSPWVYGPYWGMLVFRLLGMFSSAGLLFKLRSTHQSDVQNELLLYGLKAQAHVTTIKRTGVTINDQPEVLISFNFEDIRGKTHYQVFKKIIPLDTIELRDSSVLYLENNPNIFELV